MAVEYAAALYGIYPWLGWLVVLIAGASKEAFVCRAYGMETCCRLRLPVTREVTHLDLWRADLGTYSTASFVALRYTQLATFTINTMIPDQSFSLLNLTIK